MTSKLRILVTFICMIGLLSACNFSGSNNNSSNSTSDANNASQKDSEQTLNVVAIDEIASLDVVKAHDTVSGVVIANTTEGLYSIDKNHEPVLAAASEHEISEDGLIHTFTIRDNVWSNGESVTAHDFEYSWKRTFQNVGYYTYSFANAKILNAQEIMDGEKSPDELGIEATDDKTLVITLSGPSPLLNYSLAFTAFFPVNQAFVESVGEEAYGTEFDKVIYNGPFTLTDWKHDQGWQYKKNPDYRDADNVKLTEINVDVVKEESTTVNLYETGDVDLIEITSAFIDKYKNDPNYSAQVTAGLSFLRFNHGNEALSNENIRRALDLGWEKKALTDVILKNGSVPTYYLVPDIAKSPSGETFRSLNGDFKGTVEEAQEFFKTGLGEIGKNAIELNLLTADETDSKATAEYLKDQWETNLDGLTVNIVVQPFQRRLELEKAIDYDISISSYIPSSADPLNYLDMWVTGKSFNRMGYSNPDYDGLVNQAWNELDEEKRYELMLEAERMLFEEDAAIGPMYQDATAIISKPYVKDVIHHPTLPQYDYKWAYIEGK
ncbi:peptide ABC transporter substrate-binding protein [Bacillus sp. V33-4]|uniref:peptide ABC transporter substrate-binding protein n=1 Tax=Bacillus sp. V33-4 TaxID=2054169 RepID=UPI002155B54E|nr:peptide ABC transporter substrate-binding protein [Bacillus sp. V33-4]